MNDKAILASRGIFIVGWLYMIVNHTIPLIKNVYFAGN